MASGTGLLERTIGFSATVIVVALSGAPMSCCQSALANDDCPVSPQQPGVKDADLPARHRITLAQVDGQSDAEVAQRRITENILLYQRTVGGWPKGYDRQQELSEAQRRKVRKNSANNDALIDNGATYTEIRLLAIAFRRTGDDRCRAAALRGIEYLLSAQYANGGWPQRYPDAKGYARQITFNDDAMIGVLDLLRDVAEDKHLFPFATEHLRRRCRRAVDCGIECILNCQIHIDGRPTVWCAQHDHVTLNPTAARTYELASCSGYESVGIVRFLMQVDEPRDEVQLAIESAVDWFQRSQLLGIRQVRVEDPAFPGRYDKQVIKDLAAPPMWARFYDIQTNRPIFCDRDGVPRQNLSDISYERRNGYSWLGYYAASLLADDLPAWRDRVAR